MKEKIPDMGSPKMPEGQKEYEKLISQEQEKYEELINDIKEIFEPLPQGLGSCFGCEGSKKLTQLLKEKMTTEKIILTELAMTVRDIQNKKGMYSLVSETGRVGCGGTAGVLIDALKFIKGASANEKYKNLKFMEDLHDN